MVVLGGFKQHVEVEAALFCTPESGVNETLALRRVDSSYRNQYNG